jgi:hypothetical protein
MNFHVKFDRPIDIRGFNIWFYDSWGKMVDHDPWRRISFMQEHLLKCSNLKMIATLSPNVAEGGEDGGLQGLWGRN